MYAEQALRSCARCRARFAVQYEFGTDVIRERRRLHEGFRAVECPRCGFLNLLVLPRRVGRLVVKELVAA